MRKTNLAAAGAVLLAASLACALPSSPATEAPVIDATEIAASVAATLTAAAPPPELATDTLEPTVPPTYPPLPPRLWMTFMGSGSDAHWLEGTTASMVTLPISLGQYYDYSPSTGKILYASHFANAGAGPANLAVSDLWIADYPGGGVTAVIATDTVVEAHWSPDGHALAYILATDARYELHWRTLGGDDRILATDLAPTWSVSPTGDRIAFTRETGYELVGEPGLYVVPTAGGSEVKLSSADRHGAGGIEDQPAWSPDGSFLALGYSDVDAGTFGLVIAATDGSSSQLVTYAPTVDADVVAGGLPANILWHPDDLQFVGLGGAVESMGGPQEAVLFELDSARSQIVAATTFGTAMAVIAWATPGESVWILDDLGNIVAQDLP
jgi:WD40-like Beta Propeller Repeat